jgi:signal transduction histidine kinase
VTGADLEPQPGPSDTPGTEPGGNEPDEASASASASDPGSGARPESDVERVSVDELRTLFLFEHLDDDQLAWLHERARVVEYKPGAVIHQEGTTSTCFFVLLTGQLAMSRRIQGGEIELFRSDYRGSYTGAFTAYLADNAPKVYLSTARAVTHTRFLELPAVEFGQAIRDWFPMAAHLLDGAGTQGQAASETIERHERLLALGSVTAGLTHELNNPVAAVMRATSTLRERLAGLRTAIGRLARAGLTQAELQAIADLAGRVLDDRDDVPGLSALQISDREDELANWLDDHEVVTDWDMAPTLVAAGVSLGWLERLAGAVPSAGLEIGLLYTVGALESDALLGEISEAAGRISSLLASAKQYTQMDRAPLQSCDVHEGLEATLTMLGHKIGDGIEVVRDYDLTLPAISAYPGELNQVWTNLIDNAVDAMEGRGILTVRTRAEDENLVVQVGDTGPGVPADLRRRIFEPFFTTKPIGIGTGLGLDIAWQIVVGRHSGDIRVESVPGDTRFAVVLPVHPATPTSSSAPSA